MGQLVLLAGVVEGNLRVQALLGHVEAFEAHLEPEGRQGRLNSPQVSFGHFVRDNVQQASHYVIPLNTWLLTKEINKLKQNNKKNSLRFYGWRTASIDVHYSLQRSAIQK